MNIHKGDTGSTYLGLKKTDPTIKFLGNVDELTAWINKCRIEVDDCPESTHGKKITRILQDIENELMNIGKYVFGKYDYDMFQLRLDTYEQLFQGYTTDKFISMNTQVECDLNIARTVCRRCERSKYLTDHPGLYPMFNRISTILFKLILYVQKRLIVHK
jgi:cob(I)alamin adenosyltransferase